MSTYFEYEYNQILFFQQTHTVKEYKLSNVYKYCKWKRTYDQSENRE